jgi:pimeloyl-ACP methyl ester carboxylesterase
MALRINYEEDDGLLSYLEAGDGAAPVLLVHGNFAGKLWWSEILAEPLPGMRLIAPDLPGFGASYANGAFRPSIRFYARSLEDFLDELGVDQALLLGHSFGGTVATELALLDPDRFPALFLLAPPPHTGFYTPEYLYPLLESYRHDRWSLRAALRQTIGERIPPYFERLVDEAGRMHPASFSGNVRLLSGWNARARLHRYGNLVLVASGEHDNLVSTRSAEATARAFPMGAYANLGPVGHSPQIEAPNLVRDLLSQLLRAVST